MQPWAKVAPATTHVTTNANGPPTGSLVLSRAAFACVWAATVILHVINGVFLGAVSSLYWYMTTPGMVYFVPTLELPSLVVLRSIAGVYAALSACHGISLISMVRHSLAGKSLCLTSCRVGKQANRGRRSHRSPTMRRAVDSSVKWWQCAFSMDSQHFDTAFELREVIEIGCQTYQAFYLSKSVSSDWINGLAVATLVLNCLTTPCIHHLQRRRVVSTVAARVLCVVLDAFLDFISSVAVPLAVFVPYWKTFDPSIGDFVDNLVYDEVWYTNALHENRQLFIVTPLDFASTLLPHVSLHLCMRTIKRRIVRACLTTTSPLEHANSHRRSSGSPPDTTRTRWLQLCMCGWGAAVLAAHLTAQYDPAQVPSCKLHNNAWFSTGFPCVVLDLNCHQLATPGSEIDLSNELDKLSRPSLSLLVVAHCPALEIPSLIHQFHALDGLIILNSTIVNWPSQSSGKRLTLGYLEFLHVNFSGRDGLPPALLGGDVVFTDFEIFGSNLNLLPHNITALWPDLLTLYVEFTALETVPLAVSQLKKLQFLSLVGNRIRSLPDDALMADDSELRTLTLSGNPLEKLPSRISDRCKSVLEEISIEHTLVMELPQWTDQSLSNGVAAYATPWCAETVTNTSLSASRRSQICSEDRGTSMGLIPYARVASQHAVT